MNRNYKRQSCKSILLILNDRVAYLLGCDWEVNTTSPRFS